MAKPAWENSKADKAADRKGAKKAGKPLARWEGSPADRKMDAKTMKKGKRRG